MSHYPNHERANFLRWLSNGCPDRIVIEEHHEKFEVSADEMLTRFLTCSDTMPNTHRHLVMDQIGYDGDPLYGYSDLATVMLIQRAAGDEAALRYVEKLAEVFS